MSEIDRRGFIKKSVMGAAVCSAFPAIQGCATLFGGPDLAFIHITDSHYDSGKAKTGEWLRMFVKKVNSDFSGIDFVLFGGDNFNNNAPGKQDADEFRKIISDLKCPYYLVRGNKESSPAPKGDPLNQKEFAEMFFPGKLSVSGRDWKLTKGKNVVLGIDTTLDYHGNGIFRKESLDFVESELKNNPDKNYIILNHQVYSNFWHGKTEKDIHKYVLNNVDEVKKRLFKYPNLKLTLSGHKHLDNVRKIDTVTVISTVGFVVPQSTEDDHRFRYITMRDGRISDRLVSII